MPRGFFLTFEGIDGCGKSTQLKRLATYLRESGHDVVTTRQPGGTAFGDRLRTLLLDSRTGPLASGTELALMFADRAQCILDVIGPALAAGQIVLCDRFTDSTEAYQGGGRELGSDAVLAMHQVVCGNLQPDLTLFIQPDFDACLARARRRNADAASKRATNENRFEQEQNSFYRRVADKYAEIAARETDRISTIDGTGSIEAVFERIVAVVEARFARHGAAAPAAQAFLK